MVGEISKLDGEGANGNRSPLLPDRHATVDLFVCDIFDAVPKGDMASMEHPIFSLSTKPDRRVRRYEHGENYVEIKPSADGLATVHDRDILIFCISQLIAAINGGRAVSRRLTLKAYDLLVATNRMTNGQGYDGLEAALDRLTGTRIKTNIITGNQKETDGFGIIERYKIIRTVHDERMQEVQIELSDWVFNAIQAREVLTLHRDYFRLRKPLERRIYELARKHCGKQDTWSVSLALVQKKCGSSSTSKEFRRSLREIIDQNEQHQHIPEYRLTLSDKDVLTVHRRETIKAKAFAAFYTEPSPDLVAWVRAAWPGMDAYALHREWWEWSQEKRTILKDPAKAFQRWVTKKRATSYEDE